MQKEMELENVTLEQACPGISYDFQIQSFNKGSLIDWLLISFRGTYRFGSGGSPDAGLLKGIIETGMGVWRPFELVIDLSELNYEWGDDMVLVLDQGRDHRALFVVGPNCRRGLSTLCYGVETTKDIVDNQTYFDSLAKALHALQQKNNNP